MATPRSSSDLTHTLSSSPWKAWSIPLDLTHTRRTLCGLLNKLTTWKFDSISDKIVHLAVSIERTDDSKILDVFVRDIFRRGITDTIHMDLYVALCQKIMDELEGERSLWRRVDVFHVGNPLNCFETNLRLLVQYEFDRIFQIQEDSTALFSHASFVGELLVEALLLVNDVQGMLDTLFNQILHGDKNERDRAAVAVYRFLLPIVRAFNAFPMLDALEVVAKIEAVLKTNTISSKTRFLMMNILDQVYYPRPQDVFASTRQRIEAYGLDMSDDSEAESQLDYTASVASEQTLDQVCLYHAKAFLATRRAGEVELLFRQLQPTHRYILVSRLVSEAISGGDPCDAALVGALFFDETIRSLCGEDDSFVKGCGNELHMLQDTIIDVPCAVQLMAIILHSTPLGHREVEDLVSAVDQLDKSTRRQLVEAYYTSSTSGPPSRGESSQGHLTGDNVAETGNRAD
ncbi:hypothetical protein C8Q75DRAFT_484826 [Abortiporus biennis]|nr:hypothetical protein C8Q75DRAFT_484826 [Abortiporus biennis]